MNLQYVNPKPVRLKDHPQFNENWLKERIIEAPSILGLGDIEVKDAERIQPKAGKLDLLLQNPETGKRYEVEVMLGPVDASHIIRTIEYWDVERKRYPQYDHCAVIIAENITSRFLNVIGLFNSAIPLIAIQLNAFQWDDNVMLTFTKVLDEIALGEEDEEKTAIAVTREYWEDRGSKESLGILDECLTILHEFNPGVELKYNKYYIGLTEGGRPNNYVVFRAKKKFLRVEASITDYDTWKSKLEEAGLNVMESGRKWNQVNFTVTKTEVKENRNLLKELFETSYREQKE